MKNCEIEIKINDGFAHVIAIGEKTRANLFDIAMETLSVCKEHSLSSVLIDIRQLQGRIKIHESVAIVVKDFPVLSNPRIVTRLVIIDNKSNANRMTFFEKVARSHGFDVSFYSSPELAYDYIKKAVLEIVEP